MHSVSTSKNLSAFEAISTAQKIAFAPMLFQAAFNLRECGILAFLDQHGTKGATSLAIAQACHLSLYAVEILLDMGISGDIIEKDEDRYIMGKVGYYLLHDNMTRANMDFTQHVCYQGLFHLEESLKEARPAGLQSFGSWSTIYPGLSQLPPAAKSSWFAFDHYYSDEAFKHALPYIRSLNPSHLYDIGGNTGKWATLYCQHNPNATVTILDLPEQIALATKTIQEHKLSDRIFVHPIDILSAAPLPKHADVWWMSQFLDCFSETQILMILSKIAAVIKPEAYVCIVELFPDLQEHEAASFSLNASSLYFTCMANGTSRFYRYETFKNYITQAGFVIDQQINDLGRGHTLLICKKA